MSRPIKFRAWDKKANCWAENLSVNFMADAKLHTEISDRYIFLEFTGLLDKNGKEIYEGDLMKDINGYVSKVQWEVQESTHDNSEWVGYRGDLFNEEVIGNIYENPKLLKND